MRRTEQKAVMPCPCPRFGAMLSRILCFCWIVTLLFSASISCLAQGTTSVLTGIVFDPQGRVVPNATVTVFSDDKGIRWTAKTNEAGSWRVDALVAGTYHFNVVATGFASSAHPSFTLEMGTQKSLDTTMQVGTSSEVVTVTSEEPLIDTTAAVAGMVLEAKSLDALPTHTNTPLEFLYTTPGFTFGAYYQANANLGTMLWSNQAMSSGSMNGAGYSYFAMNYTIDGATDTNTSGQVAWVPPMDAIQEVRVAANAYDASTSRAASATVNMMMKSGGQSFHGNIYEFNKNNFWNANTVVNDAYLSRGYSWKNYHVPVVRHNEYGGMIGGPVWIPKVWDGEKRGTFFFVSWEGLRNNSPYQQPNTVSLPTIAERSGDFSSSYVTKTVSGNKTTYMNTIYDPTNYTQSGQTITRAQFAGNIIPSTRLSAMAKAMMGMLPTNMDAACATVGACSSNTINNYANVNDVQQNKFSSTSVRVDQAWNNNHHSYAEYRYNHLDQLAADVFGASNPLSSTILLRTNYGLTVNHAWVLSPNLFVNITGNATLYNSTSSSLAASQDMTKYGFSSTFAALATAKGLPTVVSPNNNSDNTGWLAWGLGSSTSGLPLGGSGNGYSKSYAYELRGYLQQIWKNHVVHYGAEWILQQLAAGDNYNSAGHFTFGNSWTKQSNTVAAGTAEGNALADFLLGLPQSGYLNNDAKTYFTQPYFGVYLQDDWRVTPKLTLNLGVRYDYQLSLKERHNQFWSRFDPNYNFADITSQVQANYTTNITGGNASGNTGIAMLQKWQPAGNVNAKGAIRYAGLNGTPDQAFDTQPSYLQPRVGFSYLIRPTTVLRGGYGRFTQASFNTGSAVPGGSYTNTTGYSASTTYNATSDNYITPGATLDSPFPNGLQSKTGNSLGVYTNPGSVSSFYDPNNKRVYTDDASLRVQQEFKGYLFEVAGVITHTVGLAEAININLPSTAAWHAAYDAYFDSTGRPAYTLPGYTAVPNPFYGNTKLQSSSSLRTSSTVNAYNLLRPSALSNNGGDLTEYKFLGKSTHYGLQASAKKRYKDGLSISYAFNWSKQMDATGFNTPAAYSQKMNRQLSANDMRFTNVVTATYELPFGKGKLILPKSNRILDTVIGGWSVSPVLNLSSGYPIYIPKNSNFFKGGSLNLGSKRTHAKMFDTSKLVSFPSSKSIPTSQLWNTNYYPEWTGVSSLPGYGYVPDATDAANGVANGVFNDFSTWISNQPSYDNNLRAAFLYNWDASAHKTIRLKNDMRLEFSFIAINAANHPMYGIISTSPSSSCVGQLSNWENTCNAMPSVSNNPRQIELSGKFHF